MTEPTTDLAAFNLPYQRKIELRRAEFDSGMKMARLIIREGKRITQVDMDADTARRLADALKSAADTL